MATRNIAYVTSADLTITLASLAIIMPGPLTMGMG
jgi:hypothetical protein